MARIEIYGDESGDFAFSDKQGGSRYFIVTTVAMTENAIAHRLLNLRRELMWSGLGLGNGFHAYNDNRAVRRAVLREIADSGLRIDSTIIPKARVGANLRRSNLHLWRFAWLMHLQRSVAHLVNAGSDMAVQAADYCGWAIQRKWERGDLRAHGAIRHLIRSEEVLFER